MADLQKNLKQKNRNKKKQTEKNETLYDLFNNEQTTEHCYYQIETNLKTNEKKLKIKNRESFNKLFDFVTTQENIEKYNIKSYQIKNIHDIQHKNENRYSIDGREKTTVSYYYKPVSEYEQTYKIVKHIFDNEL